MAKIKIIVGILLAFSLSSCFQNLNDYANRTEKTNALFYGYLKEQNFDGATNMFSDECLKTNPYDTLKMELEKINKQYGNVVRYELLENKFSKSVRENKETKEFIQTFKVTYSTGFLAKEEITYIVSKVKAFDKIDAYVFDYYNSPSQ
jgi:PBP1b-binding outer membrane lipoprotein LpoB